MPAKKQGDVPGFTLLELLAATTLLVILGSLLFQVFGQASQVMRISNGRQEIYQYVRALFSSLQRELDGALGHRDAALSTMGRPFRVYTTPSALIAFGLPVREGTDALSLSSALIGRDTVEGSATYGQIANAAHVAYWVTPDDMVLNRYESYDLASSVTGRGWEFALHVLELELRCLDQYASPPGFQRMDWESTATVDGLRRGLPSAVLIVIKLTDRDHEGLYEFDSDTKHMKLKDEFTPDDDPLVQEFRQVISMREMQ